MSDRGPKERVHRQGWASPGGAHDWLVRLLKIALPSAIGVMLAYMALTPLRKSQDISFILDKKKVDVAHERMRVQAARYRGEDNKGQAFTIDAKSAVQPTSQSPIVDIKGMSAEIGLKNGPATLVADRSRYNMDEQKLDVVGPVQFTAADGYRLQTHDVSVDMNEQRMESHGAVKGTMPLGHFSADKMQAELPDKKVVLTGRARLHINQGSIK